MKNSITIKVRGYHLDLYSHVNNARYLEFLEEARWALLDNSIDRREWHNKGFGLSIVNININYLYPATMDDVLRITSAVARIGNKSVLINQQIILENTEIIVVNAAVTFVVVDLQSGRAIKIEGDIRSDLDKMAAE
ncbi:MAG: thioesterase family protein [Candidatus Neomarinimicrobiota bacterium]